MGNLFIFGFPLCKNFSKINRKNIKQKIKNISGYFFILIVNKNSIECYTDITANYRVYYRYNKNDNKLIIFDDEHFKLNSGEKKNR